MYTFQHVYILIEQKQLKICNQYTHISRLAVIESLQLYTYISIILNLLVASCEVLMDWGTATE